MTVLSTQQMATLNAAICDIAFDNRTRQLYATDASHYQIVPAAVAFPKSAKEAAAAFQAALMAGISVTPRGAGTGLCGGALGDGLIVDFARHNRAIWDFNKEERTIRVGAGAVLDQLNEFLKPARLCFGPDVATSSRATLGGMIANNSSGAYTSVYGTTSRHVRELEIVLADGKMRRIAPEIHSLQQQRTLLEDLLTLNELIITDRFAPGLLKRWPGYALAEALTQRGNLLPILCGSEGTLAGIVSAKLNLVPLPEERGVGVLFFASVTEALQAAAEFAALNPAAIEHIDRPLFDQTRGQKEFQAARELLNLDAQPCEAILIVEFFEGAKDKLSQFKKFKAGLRQLILKTEAERILVWALRKAGLSLLTSRKGAAKPACFVEDAAVRPRDLPEYFAALEKLMAQAGVEASYYGHAAAGLLHVRPVLNLREEGDMKKFRFIAEETAALVAQFKGSLAAEHGVGMARTEFLKAQVGDELYRVMREIKISFDPNNLLNPGKIIGTARYKIDEDLRQNTAAVTLPFEPHLAFVGRDESFTANLDQCNGCGGCIKSTPMMCPTYIATGEEGMSTRGRANLIRAALELREIADPLASEELEFALSNCLSCRACITECPSGVNLPLLKAELQHAKTKRDGLTRFQKLVSSVDCIGRIGCAMPTLANFLLNFPMAQRIFGNHFGITAEHPTPEFARERFDRWFAKRQVVTSIRRGSVMLWDDTFVRYHEPHIGKAAVQVLEAAGYTVTLPTKRKCCGRPAFSVGNLTEVEKLGRHNLALLAAKSGNAPILFLEPSCYSMFMQDYIEMKLPGAEEIAKRCVLFEQFIADLLDRKPDALKFNKRNFRVIIHAHCHVKSHMDTGFMERLAARIPGCNATLLDSGCCGMAGAFGMMKDKHNLSVKIAEPLLAQIAAQPFGTTTVVSGTSCRHQVQHLATVRTRHMAEILAEALA